MSKKILITGANSYVGISFEKYMSQWPDEYQIDTIDMIGDSWRNKSFSGYDVVFHVAGIAHVSADPKLKDLYYRINRDLAIETAEKAKREGIKQFIFMSSMIIYGADEPIGKEKIITRETKPTPADFYGDSKLQADLAIQKMDDKNFRVVIMRPPMIYGPGCKGNFPKLLKLAKYAFVFPDIENRRSMLYIENFCTYLKSVIELVKNGIYFPHNDETVSTTQIVTTYRFAKDKHTIKINMPHFLIKLLSNLAIFNKIFGSKIYEIEADKVNSFSFSNSLKDIIHYEATSDEG